MRMTKEVKEYAIREFKTRVAKKRESFFEPRAKEQKRFQKWADEIAKDLNEIVSNFKEDTQGDITVQVNANRYDDNGKITLTVSLKTPPPEFVAPDELKFLAELSTEESLDDLTKLLDKYFS